MRRLCFFRFSGTGMTKYVVDRMALEFEKQHTSVEIYDIEAVSAQSAALSHYDAVGIAYPVHSFNAPEIVIDFARQLPKAGFVDAFVISTAGADSWANFASSSLLIKILLNKGLHVYYDRQFVMPSNFAVKDSEAEVRGKIGKVNVQIPTAVHEIMNRVSYRQRPNTLTKAVSVIGRAEWLGVKCARVFYADRNRCSVCGICAKKCPNKNISVTKGRVNFSWGCGLCMRCLYICPNSAVKIHRPFRFIGFNTWYGNGELRIKN